MKILNRLVIRLLTIIPLSLASFSKNSYGFEFLVGAGAVENGDDRTHTAGLVHVGFANQWMTRGYLWGRTQGPVTETNSMVTIGRRYEIGSVKAFRGGIGITGLMEKTELKFKDAPEDNAEATSTNGGLYLGLSYDLLAIKGFTISASWDAHLFPAGTAILALVTGRKQVVAISTGLSF